MRISTDMPNNNMQYYLRMNESKSSDMLSRISEQTRVKELRDDPLAAARSVRYKSYISRMNRFSANASAVQDRLRVAEGYMQEALGIMHRVREIAVQGANGIYTKDETAAMASEVDELLKEFVNVANARSADGNTLFSGGDTESEPFRILKGFVQGAGEEKITAVEYTGTVRSSPVEISEGAYIETNFAGNRLFWAEDHLISGSENASSYTLEKDSSIQIDGMEIDFKAGDNIHAVIAKINDSGVPVKASLDPVKNSLSLETTTPHQIWLEDMEGGTLLRDLGIVGDADLTPPHNLSKDVRISQASIFDVIIKLRDDLYKGDTDAIGSSGLRGIENGFRSLVDNIAEIGSKDERLAAAKSRLDFEIPQIQSMDSKEADIDLAEAVTELKMLEFVHKASLQAAARVLQPTLMDFLR